MLNVITAINFIASVMDRDAAITRARKSSIHGNRQSRCTATKDTQVIATSRVGARIICLDAVTLALQLRFLFEMCATRLGLVSASPE
jgi:hypothetical protein